MKTKTVEEQYVQLEHREQILLGETDFFYKCFRTFMTFFINI